MVDHETREQMMERLMANPINERDKNGWTHLMHAVVHGDPHVVERVVQVSALLPNIQNYRGDTALMLAVARCGNVTNEEEARDALSIVETLLDNGARINIKNVEGETPWDLVNQLSFSWGRRNRYRIPRERLFGDVLGALAMSHRYESDSDDMEDDDGGTTDEEKAIG